MKDNITIVSHGSVISYMKRILVFKSEHKKRKVEKFENFDFDKLFKHIEF